MSDKVVSDVRGTVVFLLGEMRNGLLAHSRTLTPEQLVDNAIAETLGIIEGQFESAHEQAEHLKAGDLWTMGLTKEYWAMVNDNGEPDENSSGS